MMPENNVNLQRIFRDALLVSAASAIFFRLPILFKRTAALFTIVLLRIRPIGTA